MTIRVAVVGTGYFSQFHFDAWRRLEGVRAGRRVQPRPGGSKTGRARSGR